MLKGELERVNWEIQMWPFFTMNSFEMEMIQISSDCINLMNKNVLLEPGL